MFTFPIQESSWIMGWESTVEMNQTMVNQMNDKARMSWLQFPALVAVGDVLLPTTRREFKKHDLHSFSSSRALLKDGSNPKMERRFLITSDGLVWPFERIGTRRAAMSFLAGIMDFTLAEYALHVGQRVSTGALRSLVEPLRSPPGFPTAGHLKGFLRNHAEGMFNAEMFRAFWSKHCPQIILPDSWGDELET